MTKKQNYTGKLATPISLKEGEAKGPAVLIERLTELAEHYGIDHQNQPLNDWLAPLALALAAAHVPGFQIKTTPVKPGGRPAVRKPREDAAVLYAVEQYQDEHMQGREKRNYVRACKLIAKRAREGKLTPELEIIPEAYLVDDTKGASVEKLRGACGRAKKRRERAEKVPGATPISKMIHAAFMKL